MAAYNAVMARAGSVSSLPYQAYTGNLVAGVNAQQRAGIGNINENAGFALPQINQAISYANQAAAPITQGEIENYQNPFTSQVVNATENQFANTNAQQIEKIRGNAAAQGALGGDREAIAESVAAGQQQQSEAPVIAGLESQGYQTGLQTALAEQQQQGMAAYSLGNLGVAGENAGLTGANAQIGAGTLEQQTEQADLSANYGQFQLAQAFPYQQTQWEAGVDTGVGSQMGGTSEGTTTAPAPNPLAQIAGLGVAAAGMFAPTKSARGGGVPGFDDGGPVMPYEGAHGWIPGVGIVRGQGAPRPSGAPQQGNQGQPGAPSFSPGSLTNAASGMKNIYGGLSGQGISTDPASAGAPLESAPDATAYYGPSAEAGFGQGPVYRHGGLVNLPRHNRIELRRAGGMVSGFGAGSMPVGRGYADGGAPDENYTAVNQDRRQATADAWNAGRYYESSPGHMSIIPPGGVKRPNVPLPRPRPQPQAGFADGGSPDTIDATDITLPAGVAGLGLGQPYASTNPALTADRYSPPPVAGVGLPGAGSALGYGPAAPSVPRAGLPPQTTRGGYDPVDDPDSAYNRGVMADARARGYAPPQINGQPGYAPVAGVGADPASAGTAGVSAGQSPGLSNLIGLSPAAKAGLLQAGFGMMASRSPFLGVAVGEGGLRGAQAYTAEQQREFQNQQTVSQRALEGSKVDLEAKRIADLAQQHQDQLALETKQYQRAEQQPVVVGQDPMGRSIYGVRDPQGGFRNPISGQRLDAPPANSAGPDPMTVSGEDYLATLDKPYADQIRAISEGRQAPPNGTVLKTPYWKQMLQDLGHFEPGFDLTRWNQRVATNKEFNAGGPNSPAGAITAGNTAIQHLGHLSDAAEALGNSSVPIWNSVANYSLQQSGDPRLATFDSIRNKYIEEATKFYRGVGGNEADLQRDIATLNSAQSPAQLRAAIAAQAELMKSKINALQARWHQGMRPGAPDFPIVQPESAAQLDKIGKRAAPTAPSATSGFTGRTATNPKTGEKLRETSDGQWVP